MTMIPLVDPAAAQITLQSTGLIAIDDPESPVLVEISIDEHNRINKMIITSRHPSARITAATVRRIPLAALQRIAISMRTAPPEETWWHSDAAVKHGRSWSADHWHRVLQAAEWARETGRPGGPAQAIADLWGVSRRPTAYRWLSRARAAAALTATTHDV